MTRGDNVGLFGRDALSRLILADGTFCQRGEMFLAAGEAAASLSALMANLCEEEQIGKS